MATLLTRYAWNAGDPSTQGGLIPVRGKKFRRRLGLGGVPGRLGLSLGHPGTGSNTGTHWQAETVDSWRPSAQSHEVALRSSPAAG
jgi:hypothetical protein